ncbi:MAG: hypothetical protein REI78_15115 [Pedobacter sp.]|nr:hypothetical protein [Pedobacter sp.]MDQ8054360.1 hypothetical protein [Pedobacter sp.]
MKQHPQALVEATANAIKDNFIPKDPGLKSFSFHFTIPPGSNYRATYAQDPKGIWVLSSCEADS